MELKKITILLLLVLLLIPQNRISFASTPTIATIDTSASSVKTVASTTVAAGYSTTFIRDLVIVEVMQNNSMSGATALSSITDTQNLNWINLANFTTSGNTNTQNWAFYYAVPSSGNTFSDTVNITTKHVANPLTLFVASISGSLLSNPFDTTATASTGGNTPFTITITTSFANDLLLVFSSQGTVSTNQGTVTFPSGFATIVMNPAPANPKLGVLSGVQTPQGINTPTWVCQFGCNAGFVLISIQSINQTPVTVLQNDTFVLTETIFIASIIMILAILPFWLRRGKYALLEFFAMFLAIYLYISIQQYTFTIGTFPLIYVPVFLAIMCFIFGVALVLSRR